MGYWLAVLGLLAFGILALFSVGWIFLAIGLAMIVLGPFRRRPAIFWPPMAAVLAFLAGYLAVAPLSCFSAAESSGAVSPVVCSSLLGIAYTGAAPYEPSRVPGVEAGLVLAGAAALLIGLGMRFRAALPWRPR